MPQYSHPQYYWLLPNINGREQHEGGKILFENRLGKYESSLNVASLCALKKTISFAIKYIKWAKSEQIALIYNNTIFYELYK